MVQCSWHDTPPAFSVNLTDRPGHPLLLELNAHFCKSAHRSAARKQHHPKKWSCPNPLVLQPLTGDLVSRTFPKLADDAYSGSECLSKSRSWTKGIGRKHFSYPSWSGFKSKIGTSTLTRYSPAAARTSRHLCGLRFPKELRSSLSRRAPNRTGERSRRQIRCNPRPVHS